MVMLLLQGWLTVVAWRKGWRGRALLPMGLTLVTGFLIGLAVGASGGSMKEAMPIALLLEFGCLAALIAMALRAPRALRLAAESEERPAEGVLATNVRT